jgi:hypothetical protein
MLLKLKLFILKNPKNFKNKLDKATFYCGSEKKNKELKTNFAHFVRVVFHRSKYNLGKLAQYCHVAEVSYNLQFGEVFSACLYPVDPQNHIWLDKGNNALGWQITYYGMQLLFQLWIPQEVPDKKDVPKEVKSGPENTEVVKTGPSSETQQAVQFPLTNVKITKDPSTSFNDVGDDIDPKKLHELLNEGNWIKVKEVVSLPILGMFLPMTANIKFKHHNGCFRPKVYLHPIFTAHLNARKLVLTDRLLKKDGLIDLMKEEKPSKSIDNIYMDLHVYTSAYLKADDFEKEKEISLETPLVLSGKACTHLYSGRIVAREFLMKQATHLYKLCFDDDPNSTYELPNQETVDINESRLVALFLFLEVYRRINTMFNFMVFGDRIKFYKWVRDRIIKHHGISFAESLHRRSYYPHQSRMLFQFLTNGLACLSPVEGNARLCSCIISEQRRLPGPGDVYEIKPMKAERALEVPNYRFTATSLNARFLLHHRNYVAADDEHPYAGSRDGFTKCSTKSQSESQTSDVITPHEFLVNLVNNLKYEHVDVETGILNPYEYREDVAGLKKGDGKAGALFLSYIGGKYDYMCDKFLTDPNGPIKPVYRLLVQKRLDTMKKKLGGKKHLSTLELYKWHMRTDVGFVKQKLHNVNFVEMMHLLMVSLYKRKGMDVEEYKAAVQFIQDNGRKQNSDFDKNSFRYALKSAGNTTIAAVTLNDKNYQVRLQKFSIP